MHILKDFFLFNSSSVEKVFKPPNVCMVTIKLHVVPAPDQNIFQLFTCEIENFKPRI